MVIAANASICCSFVTWHLFFTDEKASVHTFDVANALEQVAEFVGKALLPDGTMGIGFDEMAVFEDVTVMLSTITPMKLMESNVTGELAG